MSQRTLTVDAALVATVLIWAVNFSVVKAVLSHLHPWTFNSLRLVGASILFLLLARLSPGPGILPEDRGRFLVLALVGHTAYQTLFIFGIDNTTASNTAILLGLTPVFVALLAAVLRIEKPSPRVWVGIATSVLGVYLVMKDSARVGGSLKGDVLTLGATLCWALYTVIGQPLVARYGLFKTNAYSVALGSLFFLLFAIPRLSGSSVANVPAAAWWGTLFSLVFALVVAYCFWYYGVSRVGPTNTAIYSNLTPVAALLFAWLWLGESIGALQVLGVATILVAIYLVRAPAARLT